MLLSMRTLVVVFAATIFLIVAGPASACYVDSTAGTLRTGETVHCCVTVHGSSGAKTSAFAIRVDEMSKLNFLNCELGLVESRASRRSGIQPAGWFQRFAREHSNLLVAHLSHPVYQRSIRR